MARNIILWRLVAAATLVVPGAAVYLWGDQIWPLAVFVLWTASVAYAWNGMERREMRRRMQLMLVGAQQASIDTLSHHRHDWMNELQILYGYLRLQKVDKAIAIVERIRSQMEQDSRISRLGSAELSSYLLSFRTVCDTLRLDVQVGEGLHLSKERSEDAERLARVGIAFVNVFRIRSTAAGGELNVLRLMFSEDAGHLRIEAEYEGELAAEESISQELAKLMQGIGQWQADTTMAGGARVKRRYAVAFDATGK